MATTDSTKKLIQDLSVKLLNKLSQSVVKVEAALPDDRKEQPKAPSKKTVIGGIIKEIERIGTKRLSDSLHITDAQIICDKLGVDFTEKDGSEANKNRKNVVAKRLAKHVAKEGLEESFTKLDEDEQKPVLEALQLPETAGTARAIAIKIAGEIRREGAEVVLSKMDMAFLKDLGEELSLDIHDISSQSTLIKAILTGKVPAKRARVEKKQEPISKKKPKLEAGISITDMMQHYNLTELQDYARDNGVQVSGKKKDLMKRLHDHFEGVEPTTKKAKKETKKETPKSPKKDAKKEAKKETKKPATKKADKEKEAEKEEEEVEEEAEAEEAEKPSPKKAKKDGKSKPKKADKEAEKEDAAEEAEAEEAAEEAPAEKTPKSPKKVVAKKSTKKSEKVTGER